MRHYFMRDSPFNADECLKGTHQILFQIKQSFQCQGNGYGIIEKVDSAIDAIDRFRDKSRLDN